MKAISELSTGKDLTQLDNFTTVSWHDKEILIEHSVAKFQPGMNFFRLYVVSDDILLGKTGQNYWSLEYDGVEEETFEIIKSSWIDIPEDELKSLYSDGKINSRQLEAISTAREIMD